MASYSSPNIDTDRAGCISHRNARNAAAPSEVCTSAGTCILARALTKLVQTLAASIVTLVIAADTAVAVATSTDTDAVTDCTAVTRIAAVAAGRVCVVDTRQQAVVL